MPRSTIWHSIYPKIVDRVRSQGCVDPTLRNDPPFSILSESDLRDDALDAAAYVTRLALPKREIISEEYYLVLELALQLGIDCGLFPGALSDTEKIRVEKQLADVLTPHKSWVREDLSTGYYASIATIWPFDALSKTLFARTQKPHP